MTGRRAAGLGLILLGTASWCNAGSAFFGKDGPRGGQFYFGSGGGFPGGSFHRPRGPVDNEEYYNLLGVSQTASDQEIKRAFRRLAVKAHPDKGGDPEKFKLINEAYEVLSSPEKRKLYDAYGKAGLEGGGIPGGPGMSPEDLFSFFGGMGRTSMPRRSPNLHLALEVTLEELYKGTTKKIRLNRQKVVDRRIVLDPKVVEVCIDRGMRDGQRVVLAGEADGQAGVPPGDIVIEVKEVRNPMYIRRNADLLTEMKISLTEALTGFGRPLRTLDGRQLWIKSKDGQVIRHGSTWVLEGEGMPIHGDASNRGRLFLRFAVEFPSMSLTPEQVEALKAVLPKPPQVDKASDALDAPELEAGDVRSFGSVGEAPDAGEDDQAEFRWSAGPGMRGEQVQCAQQ